MKKFKLFLLLCLILVITTACQKNSTPELSFATWGSQSEIKIIKPLIEDFEQQNNIKIELIHIPQNYFQKLHLLFASKQEPDVLLINNYYLNLYANAGLLKNLNDDFSTEIKNKTFFENAIKSLSHNGNLYAIPRDISNMVVYYNKDIFKKNNIPLPNGNWTMEEFKNTAKKLTQDGNWGVGFEEPPIFWEPILWSNGGEIFDKNGAFALNTPQSKESLKFYINLRTVDKSAPSRTNSANRTMAQIFLDEKIAMQISGRWLVPKYRQEAKFDWDVAELPKGTLGSIASSDSTGWAISQNAKNENIAVEFVKFLSSEKSITEMTKTGLITPARVDVANSSTFLNNEKPKNSIIFTKINQNARITNIPKDYNKKIEQLMKTLEPYFTGDKKINQNTTFEL